MNYFEGFRNLGDYFMGCYECAQVSLYTQSAGNVNTSVVVFLQDCASHESLSRGIDIDVHLVGLLHRHLGLNLSDVCVTTLFPFVKSGRDSAYIPARYLRRAAKMFAIPQIEIIRPTMIVSLELQVFNTFRYEFGESQAANLEAGIYSPFQIGLTEYRCRSHPGALGKINRNHRGSVEADWAAITSAL